jgi:hypothetical protein
MIGYRGTREQKGAVVFGKCSAGLVTALIILVTTLWNGAAPASPTNEELKGGVTVASYDPTDGDNTGPGRGDGRGTTGPGRGDWPGTGPPKDVPDIPPVAGGGDGPE